MLELIGTVLNVYTAPSGETKDGRKFGGDDRVQLLATEALRNGESRQRVIELRCGRSAAAFREHQGDTVTVPVRAWANGREVAFEIQDGAVPRPAAP